MTINIKESFCKLFFCDVYMYDSKLDNYYISEYRKREDSVYKQRIILIEITYNIESELLNEERIKAQ